MELIRAETNFLDYNPPVQVSQLPHRHGATRLTPADRQPSQKAPDEASASHTSDARGKWVLTKEALDKLLNHFSADRDEAGRQYEVMRLKLRRFFEWRSSLAPEELIDETINRVARRIDEGEDISNLKGYFASVARLVFMESLRDRDRSSVDLDSVAEMPAEPPFEDELKELRLRCLDNCLDNLPIESRTLILKYHLDQRRAKIDLRKQLADGLGIPMNALRIRACRLRTGLERCIRNCLGEAA
jgi:DNA-directed RNA polymerase specialized sigma24 family protein